MAVKMDSFISRVSFCVIVFYYTYMCVSCFILVVSTCQVISYRTTPLMTPSWGEEIISTKPRWTSVFVCIFFCLVCLCCFMFPPQPYTIYISYTYGTIYLNFAESAVKHQQNKQTKQICEIVSEMSSILSPSKPYLCSLVYCCFRLHCRLHGALVAVW